MREKLQSLDRNIITLIIVAVVAVGALLIANNNSSDDTAANQTEEVSAQASDSSEEITEAHDEEGESSEGSETMDAGDYTYQAQAGDSYTKIARKAVQTYGIVNGVDLSEAQIVFAETNLTQDAGTPELAVGQQITFTEDTIKAIIDEALVLDESAEAEWNHYVQFVDFNTDAVGEQA